MLRWTARITLFGLLTAAIGCEHSAPEVSDIEAEFAEFAELANVEAGALDLVSVSHSNRDGDATSASHLQMSRGDQYQFVRTVEQTMTQQSRGSRRKSSSSLSLLVTLKVCLLYTSPSPRDRQKSRMPSSA